MSNFIITSDPLAVIVWLGNQPTMNDVPAQTPKPPIPLEELITIALNNIQFLVNNAKNAEKLKNWERCNRFWFEAEHITASLFKNIIDGKIRIKNKCLK